MNRTLSEITDEALTLPQSEQLRLARTLLKKVEASGDVGAEDAWEEEIERRIQKIDAGLAKGRFFSEVLREIEADSFVVSHH
jgi:putative addiction module component (TIGR02574 family)